MSITGVGGRIESQGPIQRRPADVTHAAEGPLPFPLPTLPAHCTVPSQHRLESSLQLDPNR